MKNTSPAEARIATAFRPILAATSLSLLLASCSHTPAQTLDIDGNEQMPASSSSSEMMMESSSSMSSVSSSAVPDAMMRKEPMSIYKDGTYSAEGVYQSPAGGELVQITLTLKDDEVTSVEFSGKATHPKSLKMQEAFSTGFREFVVGKPVDSVSVGVVNGSSLTGKGFMDALSKIKTEAKA